MAQSQAAYITSLVNDPASLRNSVELDSIVSRYPYFTPARYIQAAQQHRQAPFADAMLARMHSYMGNWMLFCDFLQAAATATPLPPLVKEPEKTAEPAPEPIKTPDPASVKTQAPEPAAPLAQPVTEKRVEQATPPPPPPAAPVVIVKEEPAPAKQPEQTESIPQAAAQPPAPAAAEKQETAPTPVQPAAITNNIAHMDEVIEEAMEAAQTKDTELDELISPVFTGDYFKQQGVEVTDDLPVLTVREDAEGREQSLMVVMSFAEWLLHFKSHADRQREESEEQRALKTMWQKEKLAAAIEEENDEIPEKVFEMAVNSITKEEDLASEPLAEIYIKQGKHEKAIDMYRKLSLRNPQKNAYFARKIEDILKEKQ